MNKLFGYEKWSDKNITDDEWEDICGAPVEASSDEDCILQWKMRDEEMERQEKRMIEELEKSGMQIFKTEYSSEDLKSLWIKHFAKDLTQEQKDNCNIEAYMWQAFTYDYLLPTAIRDQAREEFRKADKSDVYIFSDTKDELVYHVSLPKDVEFYQLRLFQSEDVYFMDGQFRWCYIFPHDWFEIWYKAN